MAAYRIGVKADNARTRITKVSMDFSYEMGLVQHYFGRPQRMGRGRAALDEFLAKATIE